ncbi:MAG: hypothetical protein GOVbin1573_73 [Prokaryotic dsDNA virus sp.]|nr:MAG: hypothetical protein GOVbin1573_73 [Prokaryotic dsDNA virus sp.]|tara:strand:+ start:77 stop:511 length:435 start_codon:yes stop_codon:yes gene_type:complete
MERPNITAEVRAFIEDKLANGEIIRVEWVKHEFVMRHDHIEGEDADFYRICAYEHVGRVVKKVIGLYQPKPAGDEQLVLDGFDHLQRAYPVLRDGDRVLVPTDQLTDDELRDRAAEYDAMAEGCRLHAQEIRAFIGSRTPFLVA